MCTKNPANRALTTKGGQKNEAAGLDAGGFFCVIDNSQLTTPEYKIVVNPDNVKQYVEVPFKEYFNEDKRGLGFEYYSKYFKIHVC